MMWLMIMLIIWVWWMSGYRKRQKLKKIAKELPTNIPAMPLVGQAWIFFGTDEDRMKALQRIGRDAIQQGGTIAYWQGGELNLGVADPVVADLLLKSCLSKDKHIMKFAWIFIKNTVVTASVNIWRPRRKAMTPVFSPKNLNGFVKIFARQSAKMVELLQPMAGAGELSIWKYITTYTFDSVCETNMGVKVNSQENVDHPFLEAFDNVIAAISARMCQPWLHSEFVYRLLPSYRMSKRYVNYIDSFITKIIRENRKISNENRCEEEINTNETEFKPRSFIEVMDSKEKLLNDAELTEEVKALVSAGTDTSGVAACFTLALLARHPDVQETVYKELYEIFGDSDREVCVNDLPSMKYLELVIKESLRLYPSVPAIMREVLDDVTLPSGTTLVRGVSILMNIWGVHRNPQYWGDDAEYFRPERFLQPLKHPAQFIPFSYGMRNCIGYQYAMMSLKTVLATLLRRYRVLPPLALQPAGYPEPLKVKFNVMMRDVDNFIVRLEKR